MGKAVLSLLSILSQVGKDERRMSTEGERRKKSRISRIFSSFLLAMSVVLSSSSLTVLVHDFKCFPCSVFSFGLFICLFVLMFVNGGGVL